MPYVTYRGKNASLRLYSIRFGKLVSTGGRFSCAGKTA